MHRVTLSTIAVLGKTIATGSRRRTVGAAPLVSQTQWNQNMESIPSCSLTSPLVYLNSELAIFSEHYKIEIDSIDVSTNRVDRFGEGKYNQRAILMYSGIHYDAVALTPALDIPADCDQTQFEIGLEDIVNGGVQLAAKLKKAHKYTDLATFTLRCSVCQTGLKGEKDAQNHAQQTQHTSL